MPTLRGVALAPAAARWLEQTRGARVLNVFERACNLRNQDGAVLALVASERGLTPFGLVVAPDGPPPFAGLAEDSLVRVDRVARVLCVGPLRIEYGGAAQWDSRPDWEGVGRLYRGSAALAQLAAWAGKVPLAGSLLDLYRPGAGDTAQAKALLNVARRGAAGLVAGLATGSVAEATAGARALAGLGGGLTPAGDDFIVGALLAVWAGLFGSGAQALAWPIAEAAAARTTTLSAAYVSAAAAGECTVHWHTLFAAHRRGDLAAGQAAVQALASIGHTSGADALAGFLAVHYAPAAPARPAGGGDANSH